jgi:hypothetical protein
MTAARDAYNSTCKAAESTKTASLAANETVKQTSIDASRSAVGYTLQFGNYANLKAATDAANKAKFAADFAAEQAKQAAIAVARDTLRDSGDKGPM